MLSTLVKTLQFVKIVTVKYANKVETDKKILTVVLIPFFCIHLHNGLRIKLTNIEKLSGIKSVCPK